MKPTIISNTGTRIKLFVPFAMGVWARSVNPNLGPRYLLIDLALLLAIGVLLDLIYKKK